MTHAPERLVAFMKRVTPIIHEPLAQHVAEEWAARFMHEFPGFEEVNIAGVSEW